VQHASAHLIVPAGADGDAFAALLAGSDIAVEPSPDFALEAWRKLCFNVVSGALTALAARPLGEIDGARRTNVGRALALECAAVARADGVALGDTEALAIADQIARTTSKRGPSIYADRLAGRPLEWDARNGASCGSARVTASTRRTTGVPARCCARRSATATPTSCPGSRRSRSDMLPTSHIQRRPPWAMHSSSTRCGPPAASAAASSRSGTRSTSARSCSTSWSRARRSTPRRSRT
jgi:hypothetical protein